MKKIIWDIQYVSPPLVIQYCKKCGKKTEYMSSGKFRVNAQRKYLDVWLIYKCSNCDTTWNETIYSRINPHQISKEELKGFHNNDEALARQYAMDSERLQQNGVKVQLPLYEVLGNDFSVTQTVALEIRSNYYFPIKVSKILRDKLNISQSKLQGLIEQGMIEATSKESLRKLRLNKGVTLIFNHPN